MVRNILSVFLMSSIASAPAFGQTGTANLQENQLIHERSGSDWKVYSKPYILNDAKASCVAEYKDKFNQFEVIIPQDGSAVPLVKLTSNTATTKKQILGGKSVIKWFYKSRQARQAKKLSPIFTHWLMTEDNQGNQALYQELKSPEKIIASLMILPSNKKYGVRKYYMKSASAQKPSYTVAEISGKGITAALKSLKADCLNQGDWVTAKDSKGRRDRDAEVIKNLFSDQQVENIEVLGKKIAQIPQTSTYNYQTLAARGQKSLQTITALIESNNDLKNKLNAEAQAKSDSQYQELSQRSSELAQTIGKKQTRIHQISDNQEFFIKGPKVVQDIQTQVNRLSAEQTQMESTYTALLNQARNLKSQLDPLKSNVSSAQSEVNSLEAQESRQEERIRSLNQKVRQAEDSIPTMRTEMNNRNANQTALDRAAQQAADRWADRDLVQGRVVRRVEEERGITFGELRESILRVSKRMERMSERPARLAAVGDQLENFVEQLDSLIGNGNEIQRVQTRLKRLQARVKCFSKNKGLKLIPCVQTSIKLLQQGNQGDQNRIQAQNRVKCKQRKWLGLRPDKKARRRCNAAKQIAIRQARTRMAARNTEIQELNARIAVIKTTKKDPKKKATIQKLKAEAAAVKNRQQSLRAKNNQLVANARQAKRQIDIRRLANRIRKAEQVLACKVKQASNCKNLSNQLRQILTQRINEVNAELPRVRNRLYELNALEAAMERAVVDRTASRKQELLANRDNTRAAANNNVARIRQLSASISTARGNITDWDAQARRTSSRLSTTRSDLSVGRSRLAAAKQSLAQWKSINNIEQVRADRDHALASLEDKKTELNLAETALINNQNRLQRVISEQPGYASEKQGLQTAVTSLQQKKQQVDSDLVPYQAKVDAATAAKQAAMEKLTELQEAWSQVRMDLDKLF